MTEARESIWSVKQQTRDIYFVVFTGLFLGGLGLRTHEAFMEGQSVLAMSRMLWESFAPVAITAAASAMVLTETGRIINVVIASRLEERLERRKEARREEGRAEERQRWEQWNARRLEAAREDIAFDEPPPSPNGKPG